MNMLIFDSENNGYFYDIKTKELFKMPTEEYLKYKEKANNQTYMIIAFLMIISPALKIVSLPENSETFFAFTFISLFIGLCMGVLGIRWVQKQPSKYKLVPMNTRIEKGAPIKNAFGDRYKEILKRINKIIFGFLLVLLISTYGLFSLPETSFYFYVVFLYGVLVAGLALYFPFSVFNTVKKAK